MIVITIRCRFAILVVQRKLALGVDAGVNRGRVAIITLRRPGTTIGIVGFNVVTHLGDRITNVQRTRVVVVAIEVTCIFCGFARVVDTTFIHHTPFHRHVENRIGSISAFAVDTGVYVTPNAVVAIDGVFTTPSRFVGTGAAFHVA